MDRVLYPDCPARAHPARREVPLATPNVNDVAPILYEFLRITPPTVVDGFTQDPVDGVTVRDGARGCKGPSGGRRRSSALRELTFRPKRIH
jgi:hypothetical protein